MKAIYRIIPLFIILLVGIIACSSNEVSETYIYIYIFARDLIVPLIIIALIVED